MVDNNTLHNNSTHLSNLNNTHLNSNLHHNNLNSIHPNKTLDNKEATVHMKTQEWVWEWNKEWTTIHMVKVTDRMFYHLVTEI